MTPEEYLRVCGWVDRWTQTLERDETRWMHEKRSDSTLTTAEAVEAQLAEDRARLAFVLERSRVRIPKALDDDWAVEPKE